jgi:hypothetical protein
MKKIFLSFNITQKLLLFFLLSIALSLIPFLVIMYHTVKPKVIEQSLIDINYRTKNIVTNLQTQLNHAQTLAISLARMGENLSHNSNSDKKSLNRFLQQAKNNINIAGGGIWPEEYLYNKQKKLASFFWARDSSNNFIFIDDYNQDNPKSYHNEDWYKPLKKANKDTIYWSEPYKDPYTNVAMVTVSVGMYKENTFIGISTIDVALTGIEELISEQTGAFDGYTYLVDNKHNIIVNQGIKKEAIPASLSKNIIFTNDKFVGSVDVNG